MQFEVIFGWGVVFAKIVGVVSADIGPMGIDAAAPIDLQMLATAFDQQHPAVVVFVDLDMVMGNLPEQMFEVVL